MNALAAVIEALVSMDPARVVAAEQDLEGLRIATPEELRRHEAELRLAATLASAAADHWRQIAGIAALNAAGYSALGVPASAPQPPGGCHV